MPQDTTILTKQHTATLDDQFVFKKDFFYKKLIHKFFSIAFECFQL